MVYTDHNLRRLLYCFSLIAISAFSPSQAKADFTIDLEGGQVVPAAVSGSVLSWTQTNDDGTVSQESCVMHECGILFPLLAERGRDAIPCDSTLMTYLRAYYGNCGNTDGTCRHYQAHGQTDINGSELGCGQYIAPPYGMIFKEVGCSWNSTDSQSNVVTHYRGVPDAKGAGDSTHDGFDMTGCQATHVLEAGRCYIGEYSDPPDCGYNERVWDKWTFAQCEAASTCDQIWDAIAANDPKVGMLGHLAAALGDVVAGLPAGEQDVFAPFDSNAMDCPPAYATCSVTGGVFGEIGSDGEPTGNTTDDPSFDGGTGGTGGTGGGGGESECDPAVSTCPTTEEEEEENPDGTSADVDTDFLPSDLDGNDVVLPSLTTSGAASASAACPAPVDIPLMYGASASIDFAPFCSAASSIRAFMLLAGALMGFRIAVGGA